MSQSQQPPKTHPKLQPDGFARWPGPRRFEDVGIEQNSWARRQYPSIGWIEPSFRPWWRRPGTRIGAAVLAVVAGFLISAVATAVLSR